MARKSKTYSDLIKLAKTYGVEKNALFVQVAEQYSVQQLVIQRIKSELQKEEELNRLSAVHQPQKRSNKQQRQRQRKHPRAPRTRDQAHQAHRNLQVPLPQVLRQQRKRHRRLQLPPNRQRKALKRQKLLRRKPLHLRKLLRTLLMTKPPAPHVHGAARKSMRKTEIRGRMQWISLLRHLSRQTLSCNATR